MAKSVGIIVGSIRKESWSKKIATEVSKLFSSEFDVKFVKIGDLQMYNQDLDDEGNVPKQWERFRGEVKQLDAVLFVTPEYNRTIPPLLKNAIDVGSRPMGQNAWDQKAGGVISVSPGAIGGFGANHILRQSAVFINVMMLQQPEAYVAEVYKSFDDNGQITDRTKAYLQNFVDAYSVWVNKIS